MNKSESIAKLAESLAKAQGQIEGAAKDADNPFFRSKYADLASCWQAARKPLSENGLSIIQLTSMQEESILLETILAHSSGEWISSALSITPGHTDKSGQFWPLKDAQAVGSAITYARRYALAAMVGIAPEDDDGEGALGRKPGHSAQDDGPREKEARRVHETQRAEKPAGGPTRPLPGPFKGDWRKAVCYFGKNKDVSLGAMTDKMREFYYQRSQIQQTGKYAPSEADLLFKSALEAWKAEQSPSTGNEPAHEDPDEKSDLLNSLADSLELAAIDTALFLRVAAREGWTAATAYGDITAKEAKAMLDKSAEVVAACREMQG